MGTVSKFGSAEKRLLDPSNAALEGQARVNAEIFTAVEILGRKLERVEAERDRLARRLALIESGATVDEKTGKLYLPALPAQAHAPAAAATPKWIGVAAMMSSAVALFALGLVLFREPAPALTKDQVALLESLRNTQFTQLSPDNKGWKSLENETAESANAGPAGIPPNTPPAVTSAAPAVSAPTTQAAVAATPAQPAPAPAAAQSPAPATTARAAQLPSPSELARLEQTAEAAKPLAAPVPSDTPPPLPLTATGKAANTNVPEINPQTVLIPGEDVIPGKTSKKIAKKAAVPAQDSEDTADNDRADNSSAKTGNIVPASAVAGGMAPDENLPKKLALLQKRAYKGVPEAQHDLATLYAAGTVVPQDYHRAAFWFTKAADNGVANANYNMGVIYHQGLGVPVDMAKALDWYARAAELGHPEAMYNLGIAYIEGIGTKTDIPKGVSYFKRAAKAGVVQAAYNLGVLYESNFIGPIDTRKAIEWYKVAAKAGHKGAQEALARLEAKGDVKGAVAAADSGAQAQTLANKVEPAAGGDEETSEGDASPVSENAGTLRSNSGPKTLLADIQRILIKQGALPGNPDGVLTQQTEDAIRASQKKFGLTEDGQPSRQLLEKLLEAPPTEERPFP